MGTVKHWPFDPWEKGMCACYHPKDWRYFITARVEKCSSCGAERATKIPWYHNEEFWPAVAKRPN